MIQVTYEVIIDNGILCHKMMILSKGKLNAFSFQRCVESSGSFHFYVIIVLIIISILSFVVLMDTTGTYIVPLLYKLVIVSSRFNHFLKWYYHASSTYSKIFLVIIG